MSERVRTEIQSLRAFGVSFAVAAHLWPQAVGAGVTGLDAFFAASGFLITRNLLREAQATGRLDLAQFWARRARRLLPGALLVLLVVIAGTCALRLRTHWESGLRQAQACALYLQNVLIARQTSDYWSPRVFSGLAHFWSLSMEEQFYVAWPLLIALTLALTGRLSAAVRRWTLAGVIAAGTAASLAYGLRLAAADPAVSYFSTSACAWMFGAGGLLAALLPEPRGGPVLRVTLAWAALLGFLALCFLSPVNDSVPGTFSVLRVLVALATLAGGAPRERWAPTPLLQLRPVQWLGDLSYSVYLWHLPVLLAVEGRRGAAGLTGWDRAAVIAGTLLLAWLCKIWVEDPVRSGPVLRARPVWWTYAASAAAMAAVLLAAALPLRSLDRERARELAALRAAQREARPCLGAAALDAALSCPPESGRAEVVPAPLLAQVSPQSIFSPRPPQTVDVLPDGGPGPEAAALIGDSRATMLIPAFIPAARARGLRAYAHTGCTPRLADDDDCTAWSAGALAWLRARPEIRAVVVASSALGETDGGAARLRFWEAIPASVTRVYVVREMPSSADPDCVERALESGGEPRACGTPRALALSRDGGAARAASSPGRVSAVDLTSYLCGKDACPDVIGGVLVRHDRHHLTRLFAQTLAPYFSRALDAPAAASAAR